MNLSIRIAIALAAVTLAACADDPKPTPAASSGEPLPSVDPPKPLGPGRHSLYVTAEDGTKLAIFVWLPEGAPERKAAAVVRFTRYWRATDYTSTEAAAADQNEQLGGAYTAQGFAYVAVDARGTGASFGTNTGPWSSAEQRDAGRILSWIAEQPWSSGKAFAIGPSYEGNTAMLAAATRHPALAGVVARFYDYDPFAGLTFPGGLYNAGFVEAWASETAALDRNDRCALADVAGLPCERYSAMIRGPLPVGEDDLAQAILAHSQNLDLAAAMRAVQFRDDRLGAAESLDAVAPYRRAADLNASGIPLLVTASWLDSGTAAGALDGFEAFTGPHTVVIGAFTHGGVGDNDPLRERLPQADPPIEAQYGEAIGWFASGAVPQREIRYVTLGEGKWRTTKVWPPASTRLQVLSFDDGSTLSGGKPGAVGHDTYSVDLSATSAPHNRWLTPLDGRPVAYGDRSAEDAKLLVYSSEPLDTDTRVTGTCVLRLKLATNKPDAAVVVYLEDVDARGVSRYVTEGELRLVSRALGSAGPGRERATGRSYLRADASPMPLDTEVELVIPLQPTSALFRRGHRMRLAIGGADAGTFAPVTVAGTTFRVRRGDGGSVLELPVDDGE